MSLPTDPADTVDIVLADGRTRRVRAVIADRVRGLDSEGDLVVPLYDGATSLISLTTCCDATGKGAECSTGVVCRNCYREVDAKYGGPSTVAVARA